ncbi:hypothetical protein QVD17_03922 [Tagetes erecta]|uniref:Uncharacterized protein n=1 Tax=Tagetes erecta TaxID=13708 RepID=A0AAD8L970_TARER|nr:hypothetical protein QVD17_03922 [Tagetes erecta]
MSRESNERRRRIIEIKRNEKRGCIKRVSIAKTSSRFNHSGTFEMENEDVNVSINIEDDKASEPVNIVDDEDLEEAGKEDFVDLEETECDSSRGTKRKPSIVWDHFNKPKL